MTEKYPFPIVSEKINKTNVDILGVMYVKPFFEYYQKFFEDFIKKQDVLVIEQPVGAEFWQGEGFFKHIGDVAMAEGKKIYQVDPANLETLILDSALGVAGLLTILNQIIPKRKIERGNLIEQYQKPKKEELPRRTFLKKLGKIGLGSWLISGTLFGKLNLQAEISPESVMTYGADDFFNYGFLNYRDISIAQGITKLCNEFPDLKSIGSIHGAAHSDPIHTYLKSPALRLKKILYLPFDLFGRTKIREYTHKDNKWELTKLF